LALELNPQTGELFVSTDGGLVSFRGGATDAKGDFQNVRIFPNPVSSDFHGVVGISGLRGDTVVKITNVEGKLVWQGFSNGGTATWNVRDFSGKRPGTGVYLVFCTTADGAAHKVGKIAIIN
jgi:hypothetical protein